MYNQVILIGKIISEPMENKTDAHKRVSIVISTNRGFRNKDGQYESDSFVVQFWDGLADYAMPNLTKGTLAIIKGTLRSNMYLKNEEKIYRTDIIAERIICVPKTKDSDAVDEELPAELE